MSADQPSFHPQPDQSTDTFDEPRVTIDPKLASHIDEMFAKDIRDCASAVSRSPRAYDKAEEDLIVEGPRLVPEVTVVDFSRLQAPESLAEFLDA